LDFFIAELMGFEGEQRLVGDPTSARDHGGDNCSLSCGEVELVNVEVETVLINKLSKTWFEDLTYKVLSGT
jgi:hypothetical protein